MRNPKFKKIRPNYRKNVLEIELTEQGRRPKHYQLPFAVFDNIHIGTRNRFRSFTIEKEFRSQAVSFELEDGFKADFSSDFVLYHCDPTYDWSPFNQIKRSLKEKVGLSRLSLRVLADALRTSPSQVVRLFKEEAGAKQLAQLCKLADLVGYEIDFRLKKKTA